MNYEEYGPAPRATAADEPYRRPSKKRGFFKALAFLVILTGVFATGVAVGRGDLRVNGLSSEPARSSSAFDYSSVDKVYQLLSKDFDGKLDKGKLLDGMKSGLVNATGDPYTEFFNPAQAKTLNDELAGTFSGIGAELGTDSQNRIVIISPLSGYPAEKADLRPKDVIAAIDGQSTSGISVNSAVDKIRGPANTKVKLTIIRNDGQPFDVTVTRTKITVPSVKHRVEGSIGYLKISQFTSDTTKLVNQAVTDFQNKKIKAVILDLRSDPGGYLNSAVEVASLWLDSGKTVVQERRGATVVDTQYASGSNPLHGLPTVVLINSGSASASEIVSGALHDNGVAVLVGETSFGKGSVQEIEKLTDGSELKVTIAHWYTPDGKNIDKQGITPDTKVIISDADRKANKDPQKDRAIQILQAKIR